MLSGLKELHTIFKKDLECKSCYVQNPFDTQKLSRHDTMSVDDKEYRLIPYDSEDPADQIHLSDLFLAIWDSRKTIAVITGCFIVYGILLSLSASEEYTSSATMMPNIEQRSQLPSALQQFSGLLGSGITQGASGDEINIMLYPDIIFSKPSMYNLIYEDIYVAELDSTVSVKEYMLEHQTSGTMEIVTGALLKYTVHLPITILSAMKDLVSWVFSGSTADETEYQKARQGSFSEPDKLPGAADTNFRLTFDEYVFISEMEGRISTNHITETGLFTIEVRMPDPEIAAKVAESVINYLTDYIIEYRTERLVRNLNFTEERYKEIESEFLKAQEKLAEFRDRNVNIATARAMSEEQRLQSEYQMKFDLYTGIAQQREEARFRLLQETPVFKVLEPVSVPTTRSSPQRALMVILFAMLGFVVSLVYIYGKNKVWPMLTRRNDR